MVLEDRLLALHSKIVRLRSLEELQGTPCRSSRALPYLQAAGDLQAEADLQPK